MTKMEVSKKKNKKSKLALGWAPQAPSHVLSVPSWAPASWSLSLILHPLLPDHCSPMLQSEPQNARCSSVPDVQTPLLLGIVGCQLTFLSEAPWSVPFGTPKELQQKPECRMKTLCCVCGRILTQPNENIPTGRGKIHQKAVGRRQHRDLSRSEPQPVLEKAVAPRWVLSSTEGGLATDIYGRGFSLPWLPTHLEALWKNPHLSHPFPHHEFTGI